MATNGGDDARGARAAEASTGYRVVPAEDDVLLREGLASLLERSGFEVVGRAGNGSELLDLVRELKPDLVLVDIRMPPTYSTEGVAAAHVIRRERQGQRMVEASRDELRVLADEQAALRRVATLVARGVSPGEVFNAVVAEMRLLLDADVTALERSNLGRKDSQIHPARPRRAGWHQETGPLPRLATALADPRPSRDARRRS